MRIPENRTELFQHFGFVGGKTFDLPSYCGETAFANGAIKYWLTSVIKAGSRIAKALRVLQD